MTTKPSPFVYWAQNAKKIFLRVDLKDTKDQTVSTTKRSITFSATGIGAKGTAEYEFILGLAHDIKKNSQTVRVSGSHVDIELVKETDGFWTNLIDTPRPHWLKFDFDRFEDPDGESDNPDDFLHHDNLSSEEKMQRWAKRYGGKLPEQVDKADQFVMDFVTKFYLFSYNILMFLFHFYILSTLFYGFSTQGNSFYKSTAFWETHSQSFFVTTALQYLDVLHGISGLTNTKITTGALQVTGRLVIFAIINACPLLHTATTTFVLLVVYYLIEQFRYPYYAVSSLSLDVHTLTWLRYSAWILLYPLGLILELITMLQAVPVFYDSDNGFDLFIGIRVNIGVLLGVFVLFGFPPIAYTLLSHMRRQRSKKISAKSKAASKKIR